MILSGGYPVPLLRARFLGAASIFVSGLAASVDPLTDSYHTAT
jgi:hypothetical protein